MKTPRMGLVLLPASFCLLAIMACSAVPFAKRATPTPASTATPRPTRTANPAPTRTPMPTPTPTLLPTPTPQVIHGAGGNVSLKPVFREGEVYRTRMLAEQTIEQSIQGERYRSDQRIGFEYTYSVVSVDSAGGSWVDLLYTWALLEQDTPMGKIEYDSADPPPEIPPGAEGISALVGNGVSVHVSPEWKILEIRGLEEFYRNMIGGMGLDDPEREAEFLELFRRQFGEEAIKSQFGDLMAHVPPEPVDVGESWTSEMVLTSMMPAVVNTTYTLVSIEGGVATVKVESTIAPNPDGGFVDFGTIKIGYALSGRQQGEMQVDMVTGLADSEIEQVMSGEMTLVIGEDRTTVPIFVKGTTTVESELEK